MAKNERKDDRMDSFPGGQIGAGRVHVPIHNDGEDGMDASINPLNGIYSGMLKRSARQTGKFCPPGVYENLDEVEGGSGV
jgi:hypothetical protein